MAETPRSSFIPKQTTTSVSSRPQKKRRFNILGFVATTLLIVSLCVAAGMYFYKEYKLKELAEEKIHLSEERDRFNDAEMASVQELSRRILAADYLIDNHLSPSKLFDTLELSTKESVQFNDFTFEQTPSREASISISGETDEFNAVALQELQFGDGNNIFENTIFSNITTQDVNTEGDDEGDGPEIEQVSEVVFTITGDINFSDLLYDGVAPAIVPDTVPEEDLFFSTTTANTATSSDGVFPSIEDGDLIENQ